MKKLATSLIVISMLATSLSVFAESSETPSHPHPQASLDTNVVIASPGIADFEIFSKENSARAIDEMIGLMTINLDNDTAKKVADTSEI